MSKRPHWNVRKETSKQDVTERKRGGKGNENRQGNQGRQKTRRIQSEDTLLGKQDKEGSKERVQGENVVRKTDKQRRKQAQNTDLKRRSKVKA